MNTWTAVYARIICINKPREPDQHIVPAERVEIRPEIDPVRPDRIGYQRDRHPDKKETGQLIVFPALRKKEKVRNYKQDIREPQVIRYNKPLAERYPVVKRDMYRLKPIRIQIAEHYPPYQIHSSIEQSPRMTVFS